MAIRLNQSLMDSLRSAISTTQTQADQVESTNFNAQALESRITAANEAASSADNMAEQHEVMKQGYEDQLSPPPTKTVQEASGKKGAMTSREVVDEAEVRAIKAKIAAKDTQILQAQQAADDARGEVTALEGERVSDDSVTGTQQGQLDNLVSQLDALMTQMEDPNTDLEGDAFQNQLKDTIELSETLAEELSEIEDDSEGNSLEIYWDEISNGFAEINNKLVEETTIQPEAISPDNNYGEFFTEMDEKFLKLIEHLENEGFQTGELDENGEIKLDADGNPLTSQNPIDIDLVRSARDMIVNEQNNFLGGITRDDETKMGMLLGIMNYIEKGIDQGLGVNLEELTQLNGASTAVGGLLSGGGSDFNLVIQNKVNSMDENMEVLMDTEVGRNNVDYQNFQERFLSVFTNINNTPFQLVGMEAEDIEKFDNFNDLLRATKDDHLSNGSFDDAAAGNLMDTGNELMDLLVDKYGYDDYDPETSTVISTDGSTSTSGSSSRGAARR